MILIVKGGLMLNILEQLEDITNNSKHIDFIDNVDYSGKTFKSEDFSSVRFHNCKFNDCSFVDCNFDYVFFYDCSFSGEFLKTNFKEVDFLRCILENCSFVEAKIENSNFYKGCLLNEVSFLNCDMSTLLEHYTDGSTSWSNIEFDCVLSDCCFYQSKLCGVSFNGFTSNSSFKDAVLKDCAFLGGHKFQGIKGLNFDGADLINTRFPFNSDLRTCNFDNATIDKYTSVSIEDGRASYERCLNKEFGLIDSRQQLTKNDNDFDR